MFYAMTIDLSRKGEDQASSARRLLNPCKGN